LGVSSPDSFLGSPLSFPGFLVRHACGNPFANFGYIKPQLSAELSGAGQLASGYQSVQCRNADA
jgi:hypothetical protein